MLQSQATGEVASDLRIKADMMKYAAIVISTAPIMLLYPFVQKYFNQGVMIGALKEQEKNMKSKSFTYLFLGTVTLAGLTACANSNNANTDDKSGEDSYKITTVRWSDWGEDYHKGFLTDSAKEAGIDVKWDTLVAADWSDKKSVLVD